MKLPLGGTKVQYSTYSGFNVPSTIYLYISLFLFFLQKAPEKCSESRSFPLHSALKEIRMKKKGLIRFNSNVAGYCTLKFNAVQHCFKQILNIDNRKNSSLQCIQGCECVQLCCGLSRCGLPLKMLGFSQSADRRAAHQPMEIRYTCAVQAELCLHC